MRTLVGNLLLEEIKVINGVPIEGVIASSHNISVVEYAQSHIMRLGVDAKEFVFALLPLALRINIFIHIVNLADVLPFIILK